MVSRPGGVSGNGGGGGSSFGRAPLGAFWSRDRDPGLPREASFPGDGRIAGSGEESVAVFVVFLIWVPLTPCLAPGPHGVLLHRSAEEHERHPRPFVARTGRGEVSMANHAEGGVYVAF